MNPAQPDLPDPSDFLGAAGRTPVGRRRFIAGTGAVAGASAIGSLLPAGAASAVPPPGASNFHILPAAIRLADTREGGYDYETIEPNRHLRVKITGRPGVPETATAAVLTVTAVNWAELNHVTVYPTGLPMPEVSTLNLMPGAVNANMATVKLGANGSVDLWSHGLCHMIVDLLGYYEPVTDDVEEGRYIPVDPWRAYDSRETPNPLPANESYTVVDVSAAVPPHAGSVVINLTAAGSTAGGHFTAMPVDVPGPPTTSSLNVSGPGENRAAGVVVPVRTVDGRREIKIYAHRSAFIIVDVFGFYTNELASASSEGLFIPISPVRIKDTRLPGEIGRMWNDWVVEATLPPEIEGKAGAVAVNLTGVLSRAAGHLTISAARRMPIPPNTSNVNWSTPGAIVPNHAITLVTDTYGLQVYNFSGSHVLVDLFGYFTGTPKSPIYAEYQNPPPPPAAPPWILRVPRLGLTSSIIPGTADVVDLIDPVSGKGYTWHWTGTGYMAQLAHVAAFGHRTEAGGPYRYVDQMVPGDLISITTGDGREFTYRMVRRDLTDAATPNILNATRAHPGSTFSLVACTVGYDSSKSAYPNAWAPTSLKYRIVVTFELVSWREV